ncbi:mechanosensitive ion channel family protein [Nemorincola caseinilytica]|uniref:Mechanosensitive ion channel family protein n=1 Tax=Nemorincola caseinilytica TaxID=2054315 RepID=A0ABP8NDQ0_9BACT
MHFLLDKVFFNNTVQDWTIAVGIVVGTIIGVAIAGGAVIRSLKKAAERTVNHYDDILILAVEKFIFPLLYLGGIYAALSYLTLPPKADKVIHWLLLLLYTYFILRIVTGVIQYMVTSFLSKQEGGDTKQKQARGFIIIAKFVVWVVGFVFVLDNLGFNVSAIIAGLGVGGIAIALAAQTVLGDLFAYFIIFFDRPFEIGDNISFDKEQGTVEYIGVKSTRIRTLNGQLLICSNKDLTNARVNNYRSLSKRRVVFKIGVVYQTPAHVVAALPDMIRDIVTAHEQVEYERGHFIGFGESSLDIEFVYYIMAPEYKTYMDIQQDINLTILRTFEQQGIRFAHPTRTLYVQEQAAK